MDQAYDLLRESNLRITPQRKAILQVLFNSRESHLNIENICALLAGKGEKRIGLATVYRTMELFEKIGLVSRMYIEKSPAQYELIIYDKPRHHHLICLKCGLVQEISDFDVEEFKAHIEEDKDFEVTGKPMKIYGYCSNCREASGTSRAEKA